MGDSAGEELSPLVVSGARRLCQPLQELPDSLSGIGLSGDEASDASFEGFPTPKRVQKLSSLLLEFVSCRQQPLPLWHQLLGVMSSLLAIIPWSCLQMRSPAAPQRLRLSPSRFHVGVLGRFLPRGSSVVLRRVPSACRSTTRPSTARSRSVYRRFELRVGRLSSRRPSVLLMASNVLGLFHQTLGTSCSALRGSGISSGPSGSFGLPLCGQHNSSVLSEEAGWDSLRGSELRGSGCTVSLRGQSGSPGSSVHSGLFERSCRLPQSPLPGPRLGVNPLSPSVSGASSLVAGHH